MLDRKQWECQERDLIKDVRAKRETRDVGDRGGWRWEEAAGRGGHDLAGGKSRRAFNDYVFLYGSFVRA